VTFDFERRRIGEESAFGWRKISNLLVARMRARHVPLEAQLVPAAEVKEAASSDIETSRQRYAGYKGVGPGNRDMCR
jgi:hypothetical protein